MAAFLSGIKDFFGGVKEKVVPTENPLKTKPKRYKCDVVVIGGGYQGLACLKSLRDQGINAVLVTEGKLGDGQSIINHGWAHQGELALGKPGGEGLAKAMKTQGKAVEEMYVKNSKTDVFVVASKDAFELRKKNAKAAGFGNLDEKAQKDDKQGHVVYRAADYVFDKEKTVQKLALGHGDHIGCNMAVEKLILHDEAECAKLKEKADENGISYSNQWDVACKNKITGKTWNINTKFVVIAAGCGLKKVLKSLPGAEEGFTAGGLVNKKQQEQSDTLVNPHHLVRRVHMFCIKMPKTNKIMGTDSWMVNLEGVEGTVPTLIACNPEYSQDEVVFYCTPFAGMPTEDTPETEQHKKEHKQLGDGLARWGRKEVPNKKYFEALMETIFVVQPLMKAAVLTKEVQFAYYGAWKQDAGHDNRPMVPHVQYVDLKEKGEMDTYPNLVAVNPQLCCFTQQVCQQVVDKVSMSNVTDWSHRKSRAGGTADASDGEPGNPTASGGVSSLRVTPSFAIGNDAESIKKYTAAMPEQDKWFKWEPLEGFCKNQMKTDYYERKNLAPSSPKASSS